MTWQTQERVSSAKFSRPLPLWAVIRATIRAGKHSNSDSPGNYTGNARCGQHPAPPQRWHALGCFLPCAPSTLWCCGRLVGTAASPLGSCATETQRNATAAAISTQLVAAPGLLPCTRQCIFVLWRQSAQLRHPACQLCGRATRSALRVEYAQHGCVAGRDGQGNPFVFCVL